MKKSELKFLVCGLGSIGERHVKVLTELLDKPPAVFRQTQRESREVTPEKVFWNLSEALAFSPDVAVICNPTSCHIDLAIKLAGEGCHLFIEKPLGHELNRVGELSNILEKNERHCMVGYMMRFHPLIARMKKIVVSKEMGAVLSYNSIWGEYLPGWHPWENYKESYAAQKKMGGGAALTLSHELDLVSFFFPSAELVDSQCSPNKKLGLDVDEASFFKFRLDEEIFAHVEVNYWDEPTRRETTIDFERGRLRFEYNNNRLIQTYKDGREFEFKVEGFKRDQLFKDEWSYFLKCLSSDQAPKPGLDEASRVLNWALTIG